MAIHCAAMTALDGKWPPNCCRTNRSPEVEILPCHQLTPELAPVVSRVETVIFIDCAQGCKPREMCCEEVRSDFGVTTFTHHLTPGCYFSP